MNAFTALAKPNEEKAHRIIPTGKVEGAGVSADGTVTGNLSVTFPLAEIAKSKASKGEKGSIGFMCDPIEFTVNGQRFALRPGWVTLSAR
jgi:hypothetical protein